MAECEVCGNDYDKAFQVMTSDGTGTHVFDSFECAIHQLAPVCVRCHCRIIGHGVEAVDAMYCSASCAAAAGVVGVRDRI
ncbi:Prokaryotic metallothionein [Amycolatopsis mongoliensis]|uniref:Prokaryotic metallothionein n=1 Tax=Amycolatopsis mongoliensis TaxID=715475 RepID=A0A9Y2NB95_9PSEU|nr:Prokaryotic metallothionein [Amycolatopsis sp. 4-36]WIX98246.1 Prokaryotic metallothionein [Amycolatopsis sp. 4-36]